MSRFTSASSIRTSTSQGTTRINVQPISTSQINLNRPSTQPEPPPQPQAPPVTPPQPQNLPQIRLQPAPPIIARRDIALISPFNENMIKIKIGFSEPISIGYIVFIYVLITISALIIIAISESVK